MAIPQNLQASANAGNLRGTLAGAGATVLTGWLTKAGLIASAAQFLNCDQITIMTLVAAVSGAVINYLVTHYSMAGTLDAIYRAIPEVFPAGTPEKNAGSKTGKV